MRSDSVKCGTAQAPHRSLFNALGYTEEEANWGEGSPYVMNMADEKRDPTKNPNWKQMLSVKSAGLFPCAVM